MKASIITIIASFCFALSLSAQCPTESMNEFVWENGTGEGAVWKKGDKSNQYTFGTVEVLVALEDENKLNIDSKNNGTALNTYTKTMGNYGEGYLTFGMTAQNSDQEVSFVFDFSEPVYLKDFEISDIDFVGYEYYETNRANQSYQDEVQVVASLNGVEVPISIRPATENDSKVTIDMEAQLIMATYENQENGNISADDNKGKVFLTGATAIDYFKVTYSNGAQDAAQEQQVGAGNGKSDDQAIRLGTFLHCAQSNALPVEMAYFEGSNMDEIVELEWATVSETNSDYFLVERSIDGSSYQTIGKIAGNGNSSDLNEYFFTDNKPRGQKMYYRLKQVDLNGSFEISETITIENRLAPKTAIKLFPNPTVDRVNIELGHTNEDVAISIADMSGKIIMQDQIASGEYAKQFDVNHLPAGTYIVLVGGSHPQTQKFIKQGAGR